MYNVIGPRGPQRGTSPRKDSTMGMINVLFVNNAGGGYAKEVPVEEGTTLEEFFNDQMGEVDSGKFQVSLNGQGALGSTVLASGNRVTVTPTNVKGNEDDDPVEPKEATGDAPAEPQEASEGGEGEAVEDPAAEAGEGETGNTEAPPAE